MRGEVVWADAPSQLINAGSWLVSIAIAMVAFIGIPAIASHLSSSISGYIEMGRYLVPAVVLGKLFWEIVSISVRKYQMSEQELEETRGILNQRIDTVELFRVKDVTITRPLHLRLFGMGNVIISTSDHSTPVIVLEGVEQPYDLMTYITELTREARRKHGVREFD